MADGTDFWSLVDASGECWEWTGWVTTDGYGILFRGSGTERRGVMAHRQSYELAVGPIPSGLVLDHLCRNTRCVRPEHLEPVTQRENVLRGIGITALNARKTECPKGHPYDAENTYFRPGRDHSRTCKQCDRDRAREYQRRRRAALRQEHRA